MVKYSRMAPHELQGSFNRMLNHPLTPLPDSSPASSTFWRIASRGSVSIIPPRDFLNGRLPIGPEASHTIIMYVPYVDASMHVRLPTLALHFVDPILFVASVRLTVSHLLVPGLVVGHVKREPVAPNHHV